MGDSSLETAPAERVAGRRLDSWKEIASYLNRDVTTVQRWEKREGMPVHRHVHDKRGSVYAESEELDSWLASRRTVPEVDAGKEPDEQQKEASPDHARQPWWFWLAIGGAALIFAVVLAFLLLRERQNLPVPQKIRSIAVLPLKNLSADPGQQYLADGITEALIGRLSSIHDLRVISRTSVMRFKDTQLPVPKIGEALGVDGIVEGSVIRDGSRIRVTAQLIRAARDEHIWSETYDHEMSDVLSLESELAQELTQKVAATVTGQEQIMLKSARPVAPEVYESYLKGRFKQNGIARREQIEESIEDFQAAIQRDPAFAPAYVGLADSYDHMATIFAGVNPGEQRQKAVNAAQKALDLNPNLAEAHVALAHLDQQEWRWAEAEAEYRRALELNPNSADAYEGFSNWLLCQGRTEEALRSARYAQQLDPLGTHPSSIGWILFSARRYDEAIREFRSELDLTPDDSYTAWNLGFTLIANRQPSQAIPYLEKAAALSNRSPGVVAVLIAAYWQAGRRTDAERLLTQLEKRAQGGYVPAGAFVNAYLGIGDKEKAFEWLEKAFKEKSNLLQFMKVHPFFDPIRGDPRFSDLERRVGLL